MNDQDVATFQALFFKTFGTSIQELFNTDVTWDKIGGESGIWSPHAFLTYKGVPLAISYSTSKVMEVYGGIEESFLTSKEGFLIFAMPKKHFFSVRYRFQFWRKCDQYNTQRNLLDAVEDIISTHNRSDRAKERKPALSARAMLEKNFDL